MPPRTRSQATTPRPIIVLQSPEDRRLYRHITLPNGLVALLISDPDMGAVARADEVRRRWTVRCDHCSLKRSGLLDALCRTVTSPSYATAPPHRENA